MNTGEFQRSQRLFIDSVVNWIRNLIKGYSKFRFSRCIMSCTYYRSRISYNSRQLEFETLKFKIEFELFELERFKFEAERFDLKVLNEILIWISLNLK